MYLSRLAAIHPDEVLTNAQLSKMVDTTDEWIVEHVGIRERRILSKEVPIHMLGAQAARLTLEGETEPVELVVCALSITDYHLPSTANLVANEVGCADVPAFDVKAACSSFVFALHTLRGFIASGMYRRVLLVMPEVYTRVTDYKDRGSCILWGDAAFACLVTAEKSAGPALKVLDTFVGSRSSGAQTIKASVGGFFKQDGPAVQRFAIRKMTELLDKLAEKAPIDYMIGHQANLGILTRAAQRAGLRPEQNLTNIEKFGNCGAAGSATVLAQNVEKFRAGERIGVATVGSGLSWGGALLEMAP